jgi:hypothetical protein
MFSIADTNPRKLPRCPQHPRTVYRGFCVIDICMGFCTRSVGVHGHRRILWVGSDLQVIFSAEV